MPAAPQGHAAATPHPALPLKGGGWRLARGRSRMADVPLGSAVGPARGYNRRTRDHRGPPADPTESRPPGAAMRAPLPIDRMMDAVRQNTLVKIIEQFEAAFPD